MDIMQTNTAELTNPDPLSLQELFNLAGVTDIVPFANDILVTPEGNPEFEPYKHQIGDLNQALSNERSGLYNEPSCVSGDTEFLTPTGWKRIDSYSPGDKVSQFHPDSKNMTFCDPQEYIKEPCLTFYKLGNVRGVSQVLSHDHKVLLYAKSPLQYGNLITKWKTMTVSKMLEDFPRNNSWGVCNVFNINCEGMPLEDDLIRVMVAVIADGYFPNNCNTCVIRLKKPRKKIRLAKLLTAAGIPFTEKECLPDGFTKFSFNAPRREKIFTEEYWSCSSPQLKIVTDEVRHWDSTVKDKSAQFIFSSFKKESADFIQYAASACGFSSNLNTHRRNRRGREEVEYTVYVKHKDVYSMCLPDAVSTVPSEDGYKYCFSVPSGFLLLRHRGRIFATGNCGKTLPSQAWCLYWVGMGNKVVVTMPPVLLEQFIESLAETFPGYEKHVSLHVLNDPPKKRAALFAKWREEDCWPDIICMSYTMFAKVPRALRRKDKDGVPQIVKKPNPDDYIVGVLRNAGYACFLADEAHALKNPGSNVHKAVDYFIGDYGDSTCLLMTGTPIFNTLLDAYGLIHLISPEKYSSLAAFERFHCIYQDGENGWSVLIGFKNKLILTANLYSKSRRITKASVFPLKEPRITEVPIKLGKKHLALYKQLVRERFLELGDGEIIDALKAQALRQKCLQMVTCPQFFTEDKISNEVMATLDNMIENVDIHHNKLVLFANFQRTNEYLVERYKQYNPALIYGGKGDNNKAKNKFLRDDTCRLAVINPLSGGAGLNLHSVCSNAIFVEPTSVPGSFKQAMERMRVGHPAQKNVVSIWILKALATLSPSLTRSMLHKEKDALSITKDRESMLSELLGEE